jgi:RNA polymerase sigma-70 factor (ECF subfamily)
MVINDNQRRAIKALYTEMNSSLLAYAQSTMNDRSQAEEAVQDTFRIACAKADKFLLSPNPKGWLFNTLKNVIKNKVRSRVYLKDIVVSSFEIDENILFVDTDVLDVDFMYSDLTNVEDYKLLKKIALDKCSMIEVADEIGISVEACKKRVQRAKKKLKNFFEKHSLISW